MKRRWLVLLGLVTVAFWASQTPASPIKDAESATHALEAGMYQVKDTYSFPGFQVHQVELAVLSHFSYVVVSGRESLVIDPGRDASVYLGLAKKEGATVKAVWLSHSHADFIAGHTELASVAPTYISRKAGAGYRHEGLSEGQTIKVGEAIVKFIDTPGHTPDGMCAIVASAKEPDRPLAVFTGDTLFAGSVGRPDLLGDALPAATLAGMMYDTWTQKLSKLPDETKVFPAHGAGSLCGAHLSDDPFSTIGRERKTNPYLAHKGRAEFVAAILEDQPDAPQYFAHNAAMNRKGPEPVAWEIKSIPWIKPAEELADAKKYYLVDVRDAKEYAAGHVPNSINIDLLGRFENWVGTVVPWDAKLVLVGPEPKVREGLSRLHRVGYNRSDRPAQALDSSAWRKAGLAWRTNAMVPPRELHAQLAAGDAPQVLDVRLPSEYRGLRIGTLINIPLHELPQKANKLDPNRPVVAVCNSAYRSTMAVGLLERAGFKSVGSLAGGSEAWIEARLPVIESNRPGSAAKPGEGSLAALRLPERISAVDLKRTLADLPGSVEVVDIRPSDQFADYQVPGSRNVALADLVQDPAYQNGSLPLVVVDRDGSLAMMAAAILAQKTQRPIKVLYGGLSAWWSETELSGLGATSLPAASPGGAVSAPAAAPPVRPSSPAATPTVKPKKKSAGC